MQKTLVPRLCLSRGLELSLMKIFHFFLKRVFVIRTKTLIEKELEKISNKYKLNENQLRLLYTLKNPKINYICISFSNINQAKEAISIIKKDFKQDIFDTLELFNNNYSNSPPTRLPHPRHIKKRFVYNHSYKLIHNFMLQT